MTMNWRIILGGAFLLLAFRVDSSLSQGCDAIVCNARQHCETNLEGIGQCVCESRCTADYSPVCGSNGATYSNMCRLRVQACQTNEEITKAHDGECNNTGCDAIVCKGRQSCETNSEGVGQCVCAFLCPAIYSPVCGSDGFTHGNMCWLDVHACQTNEEITKVHDGDCNNTGCEAIVCKARQYCETNSKGIGQCVCESVCTADYSPVCGSNGATYSNMCRLRVQACQTNTEITKAHDGDCNNTGCDAIVCKARQHCETNSEGIGQCVCESICTADYSPVCGSNGGTYSNMCRLRVLACQTNEEITKAHDGECNNTAGNGGEEGAKYSYRLTVSTALLGIASLFFTRC